MKKSITFNEVEVFYTVEGNGRPVLMLHGFAEDSRIWENVKPDTDLYMLILPDLPGSGASQTLEKEHISLNEFAACMAEILNHENIEKVHFVGHSMGGYIAMEFASRYADRLLSLCLFHSSAYADDAEKIETRKKAIGFIQTHGGPAFLKTSIPGLFKDALLHKETIEQQLNQGKTFTAKALIQYYQAMIARKDHSALLPMLKIPVLFIIGEHDKAVPFQISLKQCYLPPISFVHILRKSAHMAMCEEPDKIITLLEDFLGGAESH